METIYTLNLQIILYLFATISIFCILTYYCVRNSFEIFPKKIFFIENIKTQKNKLSFNIARTFAYGFFCGFFILILEDISIKNSFLDIKSFNLYGLYTSIFAIFLISIEEKIRIKAGIFLSIKQSINEVLYNLIPANTIFILLKTANEFAQKSNNFYEYTLFSSSCKINENIYTFKFVDTTLSNYNNNMILPCIIIGLTFIILSLLHIYESKKYK